MYVRAVQLTSHSQLLQNCASLWICQGFAYTIEFFGCQFHYVNSRRSACVLAFRYLSIHQQDTSTANPEGTHRRVSIQDRKSTRLNSSHQIISYAVFCLKKKKTYNTSTNSNNNK